MIEDSWRPFISLRRRLVSAAVLVGLLLPIHADAKPGYEVHPGRTVLILPVAKRDGYVISASTNDRQHVQLEISGPSSGIEYSVRGSVDRRLVEADFGDLGRIDIRLNVGRFESDPSRKGRCKGRGASYEEGTFRGAIRVSRQEGVPEISVDGGRFYLKRHFKVNAERAKAKGRSRGATRSGRVRARPKASTA